MPGAPQSAPEIWNGQDIICSLTNNALPASLTGKKRARKKTDLLAEEPKNLVQPFNKISPELFRIAVDKVKIAMMIANICHGLALQVEEV
jgi:hypothetical protein